MWIPPRGWLFTDPKRQQRSAKLSTRVEKKFNSDDAFLMHRVFVSPFFGTEASFFPAASWYSVLKKIGKIVVKPRDSGLGAVRSPFQKAGFIA
jgi:hypothetical protein